jgi:hypothetical protein
MTQEMVFTLFVSAGGWSPRPAREATDMMTTANTTATAGTCLACGFVNATTDPATVTACTGCGERVVLTWVRGVTNKRVPCDDRCQYAIGSYCSCACGGRNHRAGYIHVDLVPAYIRERDAKRHADRLARAASKAAATRAAHATAMAELLAEHPTLEALLGDRYDGAYGFMADMRAALERGDMTPRQIEAATDAVERDAARDRARDERDAARAALAAAGVKVTEGRRVLEGEIVRVSSKESYFGYQERTVWQIMVKLADGCTVMGTLPEGIRPTSYTGGEATDEGSWAWHMAQLVGKTVRFTGTVKPSDRDETFGFYTRPTKAALVD